MPNQLINAAHWQTFTPIARAALTRIARLLVRSSSSLTPLHIARLQHRVFASTLSDEAEASAVLAISTTANAGADTASAAPEEAFVCLMRAFVQRGRAENVWRILRFYGYGTDLQLEMDYLEPFPAAANGAALELRNDGSQVLEFSEAGWEFLQNLWEEYKAVNLAQMR